MTNLEILSYVQKNGTIRFSEFMNAMRNHPDFHPVSFHRQIDFLISCNYLRGETAAYGTITITAIGEDHLRTLEEDERRCIAEEKYRNETLKAIQDQVDFLQKQYEELAKLNESTKQMAIDSHTQAKNAEAKAKKADVKGWIATGISLIVLLIDIIQNRQEIIDFFKSMLRLF